MACEPQSATLGCVGDDAFNMRKEDGGGPDEATNVVIEHIPGHNRRHHYVATGSLCFADHVCIYYVKVFATTCYTLQATRYMLHASCYMLHATSYVLYDPDVPSAAGEQEVVPQHKAQELA